MSNEMGEAYNFIKLFAVGLSVVVGIINAIISIAMGAMWRMFGQFRQEMKETLREYISNEGSSKLAMQAEIEQIMKDCHDCEVVIARLEEQIDACQKRCNEWRKLCGRE